MKTAGSESAERGGRMATSLLEDRGVLEVSGPEARSFLDRIVTCDVEPVATGRAAYGGLLSPQGKILADFILFAGPRADAFLLDCPRAVVADLAKRLSLYRLRAKITIADRSSELAVVVGWGGASEPEDAVAVAVDPRLAELGWRAVVSAGEAYAAAEPADYAAHRIALGVPEGGRDFAFGDAFPHEAMMDQVAGVAFDKGCYVGQEVVSRMQHRGTARTRTVPVRYAGEAPAAGAEVRAGDRVIGRMGTSSGGFGLATVRLDRATDALAAGEPIKAESAILTVEGRDWIRFPLPGQGAESAA